MKLNLEKHIGRVVVLDTDSAWIYIGRVQAVHADAVHLTDVDVHHRHDSSTTTERYIMDSRATGVQPNRGSVFISLRFVVSFSPLKDVIAY